MLNAASLTVNALYKQTCSHMTAVLRRLMPAKAVTAILQLRNADAKHLWRRRHGLLPAAIACTTCTSKTQGCNNCVKKQTLHTTGGSDKLTASTIDVCPTPNHRLSNGLYKTHQPPAPARRLCSAGKCSQKHSQSPGSSAAPSRAKR